MHSVLLLLAFSTTVLGFGRYKPHAAPARPQTSLWDARHPGWKEPVRYYYPYRPERVPYQQAWEEIPVPRVGPGIPPPERNGPEWWGGEVPPFNGEGWVPPQKGQFPSPKGPWPPVSENDFKRLPNPLEHPTGMIPTTTRPATTSTPTTASSVAAPAAVLPAAAAAAPAAPASDGTVNKPSPEFAALQANAANDTEGKAIDSINAALNQITVYNSVGAIILMVTGIVFVFFGHKVFKAVIFIGGFYFGGVLAYVTLSALEARDVSFGTHRDLIFLIVSIIVGLLIGSLFVCVWRLGLFAIGAMLGFTLAIMILSLGNDGLLHGIGRTIFIVVMTLVFGILILFAERPILIIGTSFAGAFALFVGIDVFVKAGLVDALRRFLASGSVEYVPAKGVYLELGGIVLVALVGIAVQWYMTRNKGHHHPHGKHAHGSRGEKTPMVAPETSQITVVTKH
ncbi:hypothetical protein SpCBS45565_g04099 [Spizellomyces sp. 'palustris']|nr:hypothetical protein SpCBS45565_g04099 [Spizellomyces sp. 'palustris']